jgi:hypothetical protein
VAGGRQQLHYRKNNYNIVDELQELNRDLRPDSFLHKSLSKILGGPGQKTNSYVRDIFMGMMLSYILVLTGQCDVSLCEPTNRAMIQKLCCTLLINDV